jgi:hypothetical protein
VPGWALIAFGACGVLLPLAASWWTPMAIDAALVALSGAAGLSVGYAHHLRKQLAGLPLELGQDAVQSQIDGRRVYRFRARLGRGRVVRSPRVTVRFVPEGGPPQGLLATVPGERHCGAWTVWATDPEAAVQGPGRFEVALEVDEGGKVWKAAGQWDHDAVRTGHFQPQFAIVSGRVRNRQEGWDRIRPEEPSQGV